MSLGMLNEVLVDNSLAINRAHTVSLHLGYVLDSAALITYRGGSGAEGP